MSSGDVEEADVMTAAPDTSPSRFARPPHRRARAPHPRRPVDGGQHPRDVRQARGARRGAVQGDRPRVDREPGDPGAGRRRHRGRVVFERRRLVGAVGEAPQKSGGPRQRRSRGSRELADRAAPSASPGLAPGARLSRPRGGQPGAVRPGAAGHTERLEHDATATSSSTCVRSWSGSATASASSTTSREGPGGIGPGGDHRRTT